MTVTGALLATVFHLLLETTVWPDSVGQWLAVLALGIGPGDEVLVPSFTWVATAHAVEHTGARPVFCDIDPATFLIDLADAEARITPRTKAIAPVHLFGNVCDVTKIEAFAASSSI